MIETAGRLAEKIILITGASGGLGRFCAQGYAADGATVLIAARSRDGLEETAALIADAGGRAFPFLCDVGDPGSIRSMIETVMSRFGRIDVLMTNAAYFAPGTISTMTDADWERQFRVNVDGVFHCMRAVLPDMTARRQGTIINISSVAAQRPSHYGVTKRAVEGMTITFAEEQRINGICVTSLRPVAAIATPGWLNARDAEAREQRSHRVSPPDSYVEAAVLLAANASLSEAGRLFTDAEVILEFASSADLDRFKAMNATVWRESIQSFAA